MILVTGAAGFLGTQLMHDLLDQGYNDIRALKLSNTEIPSSLKKFTNVQWVDCDICNYNETKEAFKGIDNVYHCAALVSYNPKEIAFMFKVNIEGTENVVKACLENKVKKLLHVSSIAAIGEAPGDVFTTELTPFKESDTVTPYGICKAKAEVSVINARNEGLNTIIINPSIIIGGNDPVKGNTKIFSSLTKFYPPGSTGFVDVRDVSECMIKLMNANTVNDRFIVNGQNLKFKEMLDLVAEATNRPKASIALNKNLLGIVWRFSTSLSKITGTTPFLMKSTAHSITNDVKYSTDKLHSTIKHKFRTVREIVGLK